MAFAIGKQIPGVGKELKSEPIKKSLGYTRFAEFFARAGILFSGICIFLSFAMGSGFDWFGIAMGISGLISSVLLGVLSEISRSVANLREL